MEFDKLKETLQNWLNPEDATEEVVDEEDSDEEETKPTAKNDLPWEEDETKSAKSSNYSLKTKDKKSKADKFDALFEDED